MSPVILITRRRAAAIILTLTATVALASGGTVWAGTRTFSDVPPSHPFFSQITWASQHNIIEGYPDGTYRPANPVTRGSAAALLGRYNGEIQLIMASSTPAPNSVFVQAVTCPPGDRALGGGGSTGATNLFITDSRPNSASEWWVRWESDDDATVVPGEIQAWALCAPMPSGL